MTSLQEHHVIFEWQFKQAIRFVFAGLLDSKSRAFMSTMNGYNYFVRQNSGWGIIPARRGYTVESTGVKLKTIPYGQNPF